MNKGFFRSYYFTCLSAVTAMMSTAISLLPNFPLIDAPPAVITQRIESLK